MFFELAVDKGYTSLFVTDTDKEYGIGLGEILTKETERLNEVNQKRNKIWAQMKVCRENGELKRQKESRTIIWKDKPSVYIPDLS